MSALTELAYFSKPSIIIPIPDSHQEENAQYFANSDAVFYLSQKELDAEKIVAKIKDLLNNKEEQQKLSQNINSIFIDYSASKIISEIKKLK